MIDNTRYTIQPTGRIVLATVALLVSGLAQPAFSATDTDTINVSASVNSEVNLTLTDNTLDFGSINPLSGTSPATSTAGGNVVSNTTVSITLPASVSITNGATNLPVSLTASYDNGSGPTNFVDNSGTLTAASVAMGVGQSASISINGSLAYGNSTPPGTYAGSVTVTAVTP